MIRLLSDAMVGSRSVPLSDTVRRMSTHTPGGLLVVVDGIDGAGKTTLARALAEGLLRRGKAVAVSKEPTTGQWGMILRESAAAGRLTPDQELEYLVKDRREHVRDFIRPALDRGEVVILVRHQ